MQLFMENNIRNINVTGNTVSNLTDAYFAGKIDSSTGGVMDIGTSAYGGVVIGNQSSNVTINNLLSNNIDTISNDNLNIGNTNALSVTIGNTGTTTSINNIDTIGNDNMYIGVNNATSITIGNTGTIISIPGLTGGGGTTNISPVGVGTNTLVVGDPTYYYFRGLTGATGIIITPDGDDIIFENTAPSTLISLTNSGIGTSLLNSIDNPNFSTKGITGGTGIYITDNTTDITVINSSPASNISLTNTGTGTSLLNSITNPNFSTKSLIGGTGITISNTTDTITLTSSSSNVTNAGSISSTSLVSSSTPNSILGLIGGTGILIDNNTTDITLVNTSPASSIHINPTSTNINDGSSLINNALTSNPIFTLKNLIAGPAITIDDSGYYLSINNTSPASGVSFGTGTLSTGLTLISQSGAGNAPYLKTKGLIAGSGITMTQNPYDITISSNSNITLTTSGSVGSNSLVDSTSAYPAFKLKGITPGPAMTMSSSGSAVTIDTLMTVGSGSAGGISLLSTYTYPNYLLKGLIAGGTGIQFSTTSNDITINNLSPAYSIALTNSSAGGTSLINSGTNPSFSLKGLKVGTGLTISSVATDITIVNSSPASSIQVNNVGTGASTSLISGNTVAPIFSIKGINVGIGLSLVNSATDIQLSSSTTLTNAGLLGTTLISSSTNPTFTTKGITGGTGITITTNATDITVSSSVALTNSGTGTSILNSITNPNFSTKGLLSVGNGFTITNNTTDVTLGIPTSSSMALSQLTTPALILTAPSLTPTTITTAATTAYTIKLPPTQGAASTFLRNDGAGNTTWTTPTLFTGATSTTSGTAGEIPAPLLGQQNFSLNGNGSWGYNIFLGARKVGATPIPAITNTTLTQVPLLGVNGTNGLVYTAGNITAPVGSTITIAVAGYYIINASFYSTAVGANVLSIFIQLNAAAIPLIGTTIASASSYAITNGIQKPSLSTVYFFIAGSVISLNAQTSAFTSTPVVTNNNIFLEVIFVGVAPT